MNTVVIFIPSSIIKEVGDFCIQGVVNEDTSYNITYFTIFEKCFHGEINIPDSGITVIGCCGRNIHQQFDTLPNYYFVLQNKFEEPKLVNVICNRIIIPLEYCRVLIYDSILFSKSELLLSPLEFIEHGNLSSDFFKTVNSSKKEKDFSVNKLDIKCSSKPSLLLLISSAILNIVISCSTKFKIFQKVSTLAVHFHNHFNNMKWALEDFSSKKTVGLKLGNYLFNIIVDWCCGIMVLYFLVNYTAIDELYKTLAIYSEVNVELVPC